MPRTDTASRVIATTPDRVYGALVDPFALVAWLPPRGMTGHVERFDPRPGGAYRMVLRYEAGSTGKTTPQTDVVEGQFLELAPGERVVQAADFVSDDPRFAGTMTMTWQLTPVDHSTRVDIRADGVPDGISAADHAAGFASSLENLARFLEG